jgi:hypothetical protein
LLEIERAISKKKILSDKVKLHHKLVERCKLLSPSATGRFGFEGREKRRLNINTIQ